MIAAGHYLRSDGTCAAPCAACRRRIPQGPATRSGAFGRSPTGLRLRNRTFGGKQARSQRPQLALGPNDSRMPKRAKHGLSAVELQAMLRAQGGACAICRRPITGIGEAAVDHDHALAAQHGHPISRGCRLCVRALLDSMCNTGIAYFSDDPDRLDAAAAYLRRWKAR